MSELSRCPNCNCEFPADSPGGLCPVCLIEQGLKNPPPLSAVNDSIKATVLPPVTGPHAPPDPAALAGLFPQLEILELIGHGGMGAVYKARQAKLDRLIALKIIRPESAEDPTFAERFNREARTLARLNHPHIVAIHDFGEVAVEHNSGKPGMLFYFLMEYVDGANLRQLFNAKELTPAQALAVVPQICDALQYAHDEGVVHRDIKPENILVDRKGRVKIADFGLAKLVAKSPEYFTLTNSHQVMGTPRYMAPEQLEGSHAVDHRADIYSLGVVFYEMLTGQVPAGHFDPPSKKVQIDVRLDEVVLRSLAREPERRYQQASEVKSDVESISTSRPTTPLTPHPTTNAVKEPSESAIAASPPPRSRSTLGHAWDGWWAERDRWFTNSVQTALGLMFIGCLIMYLSFYTKSERSQGDPNLRSIIVNYGVPSPWFHLETYPEPNVPFRWTINWFSSSSAVMLLGVALWYVTWQIEKAKAAVAGKRPHWSSSPKAMASTLAVLTVCAVIWGFHPIYLNLHALHRASDAAAKSESDGASAKNAPVTPLVHEFIGAAKRGQNDDRFKQLLGKVDINGKDQKGWTALMHAAAAGEARMVAFLMLRGADETIRDAEGHSALMLAAEAGQTVAVQMLVDMQNAHWDEDVQFRLMQIDPLSPAIRDYQSLRFTGGEKLQDRRGETALMKAAAGGHADIYAVLKVWSDEETQDQSGRTALVHAIENQRVEFLRSLIDEADASLKARPPAHGFPTSIRPDILCLTDAAGRTPLQLAEELKLDSIAERVRLYLQNIIEIMSREITTAHSQLAFSFQTRAKAYRGLGQAEAAETDFRTANQLTAAKDPSAIQAVALLETSRIGDVNRMKELLAAGLSVNSKDSDGQTPLLLAVANGHRSLALSLILLGADPAEQNRQGTSILHLAVERRDHVFLRRLRELSTITNEADANGRQAALRSFSGVDRSLLDGIEVDLSRFDVHALELLTDAQGENAALKAIRSGDLETYNLVSSHMDAIRARDRLGRTTAMHAAMNGIVEWFEPLTHELLLGVAGVENRFVGNWLTLDLDQLAVRDNGGKTAFQLAVDGGHTKIVEILRRHLEAVSANQTAEIEKGGENVMRHIRLRNSARVALGETDIEPVK